MPTARAPALPRPPSDAVVHATPAQAGAPPHPGAFEPDRYRWLVVPDVALQKARLARLHLRGKADIWSENGYGFATERPEGIIGKVFAIERIEPYDPRRLKRAFKGRGAELMKRDFPFAAEELGRRLGVPCRQRRSAGLHENRERFLGCTAGIAIFARLGQRPPRRHTGLGTAPPGYGNGNGL